MRDFAHNKSLNHQVLKEASETEKHKSTATEKPEASVQVEGTIKQGGKVNNEINKIQCHQGVRREPGMSLYEEGLRTKERHAACTRYIEEVLGRGGNTPTKVENQRIETGSIHTTPTKESARELAMASQAKVTTASGPTLTNPSHTREETAILPGHGSKHLASKFVEPQHGLYHGPFGTGGTGHCPAWPEEIRDWAGHCFKRSEAKACLTCAPGSMADRSLLNEYEKAQIEASKTAPR